MSDKLKNLSFATKYEIDDTFDSEKFIKMRIKVMHSKVNPNSSNFELDSIDEAKDSLKNIPILAHVVETENGVAFGSHDWTIEKDKMGDDFKIIYKELPIGLVPETNNYYIDEEEDAEGRHYVYTDAYIWRGYSNYAEALIEQSDSIKVSMEIVADQYELTEDNIFDIKKYRYTGITMLNDELSTGMVDANAQKVEFNMNERKANFVAMAQELKFALENQKKQNNDKGGATVVNKDTNDVDTKATIVEPEDNFELNLTQLRDKIRLYIDTDANGRRLYRYYPEDVYQTYFTYSDDDTYPDTLYYKATYSIVNNEIEVGESEEIYKMWLTSEQKAQLDADKASYQNLQKDYEKLTLTHENLQKDFVEKTTELSELNKTVTTLQTENKDLTEFKSNVEAEKQAEQRQLEQAKLDELFEEFAQELDTEIIEEIKNQGLSFEESESKLLYTLGVKNRQTKKDFSKTKNDGSVKKVIPTTQSKTDYKPSNVIYGDAEKYMPKNYNKQK
ncbi:MAG: hypothetical protein GY714_23510 [Desulfobacterales bacterium]|nr:hypothetical protein [Desulfobacterales bacterium]